MQEIENQKFCLENQKFSGGTCPQTPPEVSRSIKNPIVTRLTVPVTSASAERSFSKLKSVKTVMRSVMNQERRTLDSCV
jgi:hypothetical protein